MYILIIIILLSSSFFFLFFFFLEPQWGKFHHTGVKDPPVGRSPSKKRGLGPGPTP